MNTHVLAMAILSLASPNGITTPCFADAPMGAEHRADSLAYTFNVVATANDVDVSLLVGLAHWESGFDPDARTRSSFGIMQLNVKYHRDVRGYCKWHPERCSVAVIERGAQVLAWYKTRCKSDGRAVAAYRAGHCVRPNALSAKVLKTAAWIRRRLERA